MPTRKLPEIPQSPLPLRILSQNDGLESPVLLRNRSLNPSSPAPPPPARSVLPSDCNSGAPTPSLLKYTTSIPGSTVTPTATPNPQNFEGKPTYYA